MSTKKMTIKDKIKTINQRKINKKVNLLIKNDKKGRKIKIEIKTIINKKETLILKPEIKIVIVIETEIDNKIKFNTVKFQIF
jgi:hypothetical protein